jgi:hypothetical protein
MLEKRVVVLNKQCIQKICPTYTTLKPFLCMHINYCSTLPVLTQKIFANIAFQNAFCNLKKSPKLTCTMTKLIHPKPGMKWTRWRPCGVRLCVIETNSILWPWSSSPSNWMHVEWCALLAKIYSMVSVVGRNWRCGTSSDRRWSKYQGKGREPPTMHAEERKLEDGTEVRWSA